MFLRLTHAISALLLLWLTAWTTEASAGRRLSELGMGACTLLLPRLALSDESPVFARNLTRAVVRALADLVELPHDELKAAVLKMSPEQRFRTVRFAIFVQSVQQELLVHPGIGSLASYFETLGIAPEEVQPLLDGIPLLSKDIAKALYGLPGPQRARFLQSADLLTFPVNSRHRAERSAARNFDQWMGRLLDHVIGFDTNLLHRYRKIQTHVGTAVYTEAGFGSSYYFLERLLLELNMPPGSIIVDVGCSFGRLGFLIGARHPEVTYIGVDISPEKIAQAESARNAMDFGNVTFKVADLTAPDFIIPRADYYYLYDPVNTDSRPVLFEKLRNATAGRDAWIISSDGTGSFLSFSNEQAWLAAERLLGFPEVYSSALLLRTRRS